ncbi:LysR substrate-binding domain-containing protein [Isoptericola sp. b441]|uniref:LysR substrate-binding domain-containing protein n=1 Tax=Actinotalea lenta TaxID=3064654 RepID=A0ABT9DBG4_9CELL|nr:MULTISPECIES: LysR substrate-binding domain-containing protein [unclassified Isoptericola]MDO8108210.1 LysR substrate-binding domain-containing protein [Isoptericola sp. b441]MDO8120118.1 LysR substrate-binding domain-containing protein [Isoptericola sp. b490]
MPSPLRLDPHALRSVPDLVSLAVLRAVGDGHSLSTAAALLGLSQPAVTARVRAMERAAGTTLVARGPRGSHLTPAGTLVAEWADGVLDSASALAAGLGSLRGDAATRLRVAASLTVAEHLLPQWLARFAAAHPSTTVTLDAMNSWRVEQAVSEGSVDLGFVEGPTSPRSLHSRVVGRDRLAVVVAPGHPWATRTTPVPAGELAGTRLVQREPASGTRAHLEAALSAAGAPAPVPPVLELSSTSAVRAAATAGAGPAVLSVLAVAADLAEGRLVEVPVDVDLRRSLRAVWRTQRPGPAATELLSIVR